jgi:hypothetical protein
MRNPPPPPPLPPGFRSIEEILADETPFVNPEPGRPWTDIEFHEAHMRIEWNQKAWEVDKNAFSLESTRRMLEQERTNQFTIMLRNFLLGIVDTYTRVPSGYNPYIIFNMAASFSSGWNGLSARLGRHDGQFDDLINRRLDRKKEQLTDAFDQLARIFETFPNVTDSSIGADIRAYGEMIKAHVLAGNTISHNDYPATLYRFLSNNSTTTHTIDDLNRIGKGGFSIRGLALVSEFPNLFRV